MTDADFRKIEREGDDIYAVRAARMRRGECPCGCAKAIEDPNNDYYVSGCCCLRSFVRMVPTRTYKTPRGLVDVCVDCPNIPSGTR